MENEATSVNTNQREADKTVAKMDFSLLSNDKILNGEFVEPEKETKVEEKPATPAEATETPVETEIKVEKPEEVKAEEIKVEEKEAEVNPELEGIEEIKADPIYTDPEEGSWLYVAKEAGIEGVKEDSFESVREAILAPFKDEIEKLKTLPKEAIFAELDPQHRLHFELAQAGMPYEQIVNPTKEADRMLQMADPELVREDLKITKPNATDEWIDKEIERLTETGDITHVAQGIRNDIELIAKEEIDRRAQFIQEHKAKQEQFLQQKRQEEVQTMSKALNDMSDLMGTPLNADVKKAMAAEYSNGKYDHYLNDPAMKAKFFAFVKYGEIAQKNLEVKNYNKGKLEITKKLHNTPPLDNNVGAGRTTTEVKGNFGKLANDPLLKG